MEKLRWGLLSTARINSAVIDPLRTSNRNELVAVASRDLEHAKEYAQKRNIPRAYGSYDALLADPEIDVIYNPLPNSLHAEWTIKAAQAGKHILCEKPMALSVEEVDAMQAAAQKSGVVLAEAFMYRYHPQTLKVKQLVDNGMIGKLQLIHGTFTFKLVDPRDVRMLSDLGGGSLWDVGCYPVSYARYLASAEPEEVFGWQIDSGGGVDVTFVGQLRFPGEVYAQFDCGFSTPFRASLEVVGSEGSLIVPVPFKPGTNETIILYKNDDVQNITIIGEELYVGEVEGMADAILLGKPLKVDVADSRGNIATITALLQSAQGGQPVAIA